MGNTFEVQIGDNGENSPYEIEEGRGVEADDDSIVLLISESHLFS